MTSRQHYFEDGYLRRWGLGPPSEAQTRDAAAFLSMGTDRRPCDVLDLGCGHGRYSTGLAAAGARVVGIDASRALLRRALTQDAARQSCVRLVRGDMSALPFPQAFDMVLMVDAFGYFDSADDDERVVSEISRVLVGGGRLVARTPNGARIRNHFEPFAEEIRNGTRTVIHRTLLAAGRVLREEFAIDDGTGVEHFARDQQIYSPAELDALLDAGGFVVEDRYANAHREAFNEDTSGRMVTVARR